MKMPYEKIGFIERRYEGDIPKFKLIVCDIQKIIIGKKKTTVYTKKFYPLDYADILNNTDCMDTSTGIIVVHEPFFIRDEQIDYFNRVVDNWNVNGVKDLFE